MTLNFKRQVWIYIGIIGASILVFLGVIFFLENKIEQSVATITKDENAMAEQNAAVSIFANLKLSVTDARRYEAAMNKLLVTQDNLISFPSQVDDLGRTTGVATKFSFSGDPVPGTATTTGSYGFTLGVTGPPDSIVNFLKNLEITSPVLLSRIESFDLVQNDPNDTLSANGTLFFK